MPPAFNLSQDQTLEFNLASLPASVSGGVALKFVDWSIWKGTHRSLRSSIRLFEHLNLFNESWKDPSQKNQMPTLIGSFRFLKNSVVVIGDRFFILLNKRKKSNYFSIFIEI